LPEPPKEQLPIPFFRSNGNQAEKVSINVYDTILLMQQRQDWLRDYLKDNHSYIGQGNDESVRKNFKTFAVNLFDTNLRISCDLRKYLKQCEGHKNYKEECVWVEMMFKKLDSHLDNISIDNGETLVELRMQMEMEIERRKIKSTAAGMELT
jgi:hypothetical protein